MRRPILALLSALLLLQPGPANAQQIAGQQAELERRRAALVQEIRESQAQLADTRKDKNASMAQLRAVQNKLNARMQLIGTINQEIQQINGSINNSQQEISGLQRRLQGLKARYAQSVRYEYEHRSSYNMLAFLFSAKDYNVAVQRIKYLKRYRDYRSQQVAEIYQTQAALGLRIGTLQRDRGRHDELLLAEQRQRGVLEQETRDKNLVVSGLQGREKELMAVIQKNQKLSKQIDRTVQALIARQMELDRKRAEEERRKELERRKAEEASRQAAAAASRTTYGNVSLATGSGRPPAGPPAPTTGNNAGSRPVTTTTTPVQSGTVAGTGTPETAPRRRALSGASAGNNLNLTPAALELSNNFAANKGRLPWPVERGTIISEFGTHKHQLYNVTVDNLGIDIQTAPGATARAVFDGRVSSVVGIGGAGTVVIIQHGEYYTVYTNLTGVQVKTGDNVHTRQVIGSVMLNDEDLPVLNFQVWKSGGKLNPALWIAR